jgi:signal transduction histidine kinase
VCLLGVVSGAGRRQIFERTRQATLVALADERAEVASREASLAAERNRLGRELHDVLAHTLGALSVQLGALDALAEGDHSPDELHGQIERVHKLVDEGLDETHMAVRALRERPRTLADELARLCRQHGAAFTLQGTPRPVSAAAHLALYRIAQEALTNAARHAPGSPVAVRADFSSTAVTLTVRNPASEGPARTGNGGYGLTGIRERVLLAGGQCHAGPAGQGWRVTASIPA